MDRLRRLLNNCWGGLVLPIWIAGRADASFAQETIPQQTSHDVAFESALAPRVWQFPRDHGQHAEFRTEWWYFTGNLRSTEGRRFGYQLTFFRVALLPEAVPRASRWALREAYIAHFAITDVTREKFYYDQRVRRGALHLADAAFDSLEVHVGNWSASGGSTTMQLQAAADFGSVALSLRSSAAPVLHGQNGLFRKGQQPGESSYYYSRPHLLTQGALQLSSQTFALSGTSWMDHEFFTAPESGEVSGWNWMSLHLSDSTASMLYFLRSAQGEILPLSGGTMISALGAIRTLHSHEIVATPVAWWTSAKTGGKYPVRWRLQFGAYRLEVRAPVENQELDARATTGVVYWEGYVDVSGTNAGRSLNGAGYLEMTGQVASATPDL